MKKIFSVLLVLTLLCGVMTLGAFADADDGLFVIADSVPTENEDSAQTEIDQETCEHVWILHDIKKDADKTDSDNESLKDKDDDQASSIDDSAATTPDTTVDDADASNRQADNR